MSRHPRSLTARERGRPATWEDLDEVPEGYIGEIVAGEIVVTPRPFAPHARAATKLGASLDGPFDSGVGGPGGWVLLDEPHVRFGEEIRMPDLAGWRRERWVNPPRRGPITLAPDWICEVLSRSTEAEDRSRKMPLYARARVQHLWLLNPDTRTLEAYRLTGPEWTHIVTHAGDARVRVEPFDAIELDISVLWLPPEREDEEA